MDIDFYSKYINVNFDNILLESNNDLVNSEDHYLKYKKEYMEETQVNYEKFKEYKQKLSELSDLQYTKNASKYTYVYINDNEVNIVKHNLKNIIILQNRLFENFSHYISLLNTDKLLFKEKENPVLIKQRVNFLSKLNINLPSRSSNSRNIRISKK